MGDEKPIDVVLHCPVCGKQHIDRPDPAPECDCLIPTIEGAGQHSPTCGVFREVWTNPVHRSHTCRTEDGGCGAIWRPADVPTNGVERVTTRGKADTWPAADPARDPAARGEANVRIPYTEAPTYTGADADFDHPDEWATPIIDRPDDAGLRLVYADWLDDRGLSQRAGRQRELAAIIRDRLTSG